MSTKDLINAIVAGDALEIENAFNSTMAEKISTRLDDMRADMAANMFKQEETFQSTEE
jgi:thymidine phosphorylase